MKTIFKIIFTVLNSGIIGILGLIVMVLFGVLQMIFDNEVFIRTTTVGAIAFAFGVTYFVGAVLVDVIIRLIKNK